MRFLLRNWHLKVSAILLATILYTGFVFSGSFSVATIEVRASTVNQPERSFLLSGDLGTVRVEYRTISDRLSGVLAEAFVATVDLSEYDMERAPAPQVLPVDVTALTDGIDIISVEPSTVRVQLDRLQERTVPVEVDPGSVPQGLALGDPELSAEEVEVRGPSSVVAQVDRAVARIRIDPSGIDFDEPVALVAVDIQGQPIGAGEIDVVPAVISVQVDVEQVETTQTIPVRPQFEGAPAPGFGIQALRIEPATVTLRGLPEVLAQLDDVLTAPINLDATSADESFEVELVLPDGSRLVDDEQSVVIVSVTITPLVASRTFVVGVVCQGSGANACIPSLEQLTVTLSGPGSALSALSASALTPILNVSGLGPGTHSVAPVLVGLPDGVDLLAITPSAVSVTIRAPATPEPSPTPAP
ncbi:MAG TPA: CdaR family protein [Methylomirabilota bacterium]|nr:CdaR family protein [Methylomirabilota bacterium]